MNPKRRANARAALRRVYGLSRPVTDAELDAEVRSLRRRRTMDYDDLHFRVAGALGVAGADVEYDPRA